MGRISLAEGEDRCRPLVFLATSAALLAAPTFAQNQSGITYDCDRASLLPVAHRMGHTLVRPWPRRLAPDADGAVGFSILSGFRGTRVH